ncbi:MAG TPA: hypothetical protein VNT79_15605 [Phycisphaerae bacterium]|nr:hypothetical protein [Phycisphaerae bacterium]
MPAAKAKKAKPSRASEFRNKAAASLRASRAKIKDSERDKLTTTAKSYKALAAAEEALGGEVQKSATLPRHRKRSKARIS